MRPRKRILIMNFGEKDRSASLFYFFLSQLTDAFLHVYNYTRLQNTPAILCSFIELPDQGKKEREAILIPVKKKTIRKTNTLRSA